LIEPPGEGRGVKLPQNPAILADCTITIMNTCFLFKVKCDSEGNTTECCARANADGRQQKPGSYRETFAPTSKFSIIRTIYAIAAHENLTLYQFDIKGAFTGKLVTRHYINLISRVHFSWRHAKSMCIS